MCFIHRTRDCVFIRFDFFFFFKEEEAKRFRVRSGGLGDVYKRPPPAGGREASADQDAAVVHLEFGSIVAGELQNAIRITEPVSYTHLTLPTSDLV